MPKFPPQIQHTTIKNLVLVEAKSISVLTLSLEKRPAVLSLTPPEGSVVY